MLTHDESRALMNVLLGALREVDDERWASLAEELEEDVRQGKPAAVQIRRSKRSSVDLRTASDTAFATTQELTPTEALQLVVEGVRAALIDPVFMLRDVLADQDEGTPRSPLRGFTIRFIAPQSIGAEGDGDLRDQPQVQGRFRTVEPFERSDIQAVDALAQRLNEILAELGTDPERRA